MQEIFEYSPEVRQAISEKKPILALESTLITHGFPFPDNYETGKAVEEIARENKVTPATIAIIKGKIKIGLTTGELEWLVQNKNNHKASRRDISYIVSQGLSAGTTIAATLYCAENAGIRVFATGGIGGVHRDYPQDVSADLTELARTPIALVCSGAKAILDLPKTLELFETLSIPVVGYQTDTFPAFYTANTPYMLSARIDDVSGLVNFLKTHWQLNMPSGVLIANPIPVKNEIPAKIIEPAIADALKTAEENNISGKEITPFLLNEVVKATKGKSLQANIQLIKNNVKLGAQLAKLLHSPER